MKLIFVRHADPDYEHDSLTNQGIIEAKLLAKKLCRENFTQIYCSPLGRAQKTASYTLKKLKREATTLSWLHEFKGKCVKPTSDGKLVSCWDWPPQYIASEPLFYDKDKWFTAPLIKNTNIKQEYDIVCNQVDEFLENHGYRRNGLLYNAVKPNEDTILFFCHLGIEAVIISYLVGISPYIMLHAFAPAPSSVTTVVTEERIEGIANFRILSYADTGHLYKYNTEPSFAARYCETFSNKSQRH